MKSMRYVLSLSMLLSSPLVVAMDSTTPADTNTQADALASSKTYKFQVTDDMTPHLPGCITSSNPKEAAWIVTHAEALKLFAGYQISTESQQAIEAHYNTVAERVLNAFTAPAVIAKNKNASVVTKQMSTSHLERIKVRKAESKFLKDIKNKTAGILAANELKNQEQEQKLAKLLAERDAKIVESQRSGGLWPFAPSATQAKEDPTAKALQQLEFNEIYAKNTANCAVHDALVAIEEKTRHIVGSVNGTFEPSKLLDTITAHQKDIEQANLLIARVYASGTDFTEKTRILAKSILERHAQRIAQAQSYINKQIPTLNQISETKSLMLGTKYVDHHDMLIIASHYLPKK